MSLQLRCHDTCAPSATALAGALPPSPAPAERVIKIVIRVSKNPVMSSKKNEKNGYTCLDLGFIVAMLLYRTVHVIDDCDSEDSDCVGIPT